MKVKQSVSLPLDQVNRLNHYVESGQFRSISHFVEYAVKKYGGDE